VEFAVPIYDLFSKRQKLKRGDVPDVYVYNVIPQTLRVQVLHMLNDTLGTREQYTNSKGNGYGPYAAYKAVVDVLCREYGLMLLAGPNLRDRNYYGELNSFILTESQAERVLDCIELCFVVIDRDTRNRAYLNRGQAETLADEAIAELNSRFHEHGVGYQLEGNEIVRVDSKLLHSEVVKPALGILNGPQYAGAQEEFLGAYEHYRHGKHKEALGEALKSLESVIKSICDKRGWEYPANATGVPLINICLEKGLVPPFWQKHFSGLRSTLDSGVPTAHNKLGGHGQGSEVVEVPQHLVGYVLHMTAAAIVFLAESDRALP
jgi:hypothetical protein